MRANDRKTNSNHFLTLFEVQSFLGIKSRKTILKYILKGELSAYKLGGTRWRIAQKDVEEFLKRQHVNNGHSQLPEKPLEIAS